MKYIIFYAFIIDTYSIFYYINNLALYIQLLEILGADSVMVDVTIRLPYCVIKKELLCPAYQIVPNVIVNIHTKTARCIFARNAHMNGAVMKIKRHRMLCAICTGMC